jgi:hypothetical protein
MDQSDRSHIPEWSPAGPGASGWRQQLSELALACAGSFPADEVQRLMELRRLLASAPAPSMVRGLAVPSSERLNQLIAVDASESAALAMLGPDCGYLLSRGAGGQHLASIILPGAEEEMSAGGDSTALALVSAVALALIEAESEPATPQRKRRNRLN